MRNLWVFDMVRLSIKKYIATLFSVVLIFAVPLFFISLNVTWAFETESVYMYSVDHYEVVENTGLERKALTSSMGEMVTFFKGAIDISEVFVEVNGELQPLFSDSEQLHFDDVRDSESSRYGYGAVDDGRSQAGCCRRGSAPRGGPAGWRLVTRRGHR